MRLVRTVRALGRLHPSLDQIELPALAEAEKSFCVGCSSDVANSLERVKGHTGGVDGVPEPARSPLDSRKPQIAVRSVLLYPSVLCDSQTISRVIACSAQVAVMQGQTASDLIRPSQPNR